MNGSPEKISSTNTFPESSSEKSRESEEFLEKIVAEVAKDELETLTDEDESASSSNEINSVESKTEGRGKMLRGKMVAFCMAMTFFSGALAQTAEAGGGYKITDGIQRGAGKAVEDVFRGTSRGTSKGLEAGIQKTIYNVFGIETPEQRRNRERYENKMEREARETQRQMERQERELQRKMEQSTRAYQKEIDAASRENDKAAMSVLKDYQTGKISKAKKDELMDELEARYAKRLREIDIRHGRATNNEETPQQEAGADKNSIAE